MPFVVCPPPPPPNQKSWLRQCYSQCTNYAVIYDQIATKKSFLFFLQNVSILGKYCEKRLLRSASLQQVFDCNYRIVVKEMLLEIGFVEISFLSSIWPATRSYYSLNFGSEKIELLTIKLVYTYRVTTKCHESSIVCSIELKNVVTKAEWKKAESKDSNRSVWKCESKKVLEGVYLQ